MEMIELYLLNGGGYGMLCRILQLFVGKNQNVVLQIK